jgi:hypothetical protein
MPWSRSRTSSSAGIEGLPSGVSLARPSASGDELSPNSPDISFSSIAAGIAARDGAHQDAMRRSSMANDGTRPSPVDIPGAGAAPGPRAQPPGEIAAVLASSADVMHRDALHAYMRRFYFSGNPLDVALRKLLLSLYLPKETQQIDRVMEAFAKRYNECNEGLFETHGTCLPLHDALPPC